MHAEKCPICSGSGKVKIGETKFPCYGCDGKGWVEVRDSFPPPHPIFPEEKERPWIPFPPFQEYLPGQTGPYTYFYF